MRLDWHSTRIELSEPLRISRATIAARDAVWVSLTHRRTQGWGEVVTSPRLGITLDSVDSALRRAAEWIATETDPQRLRGRLPELRAALPSALPVVAAVDAALHDCLAVRAGQSLYSYLGMPEWDRMPTAYTLGILPVDTAVSAARDLAAAGFTVLKLKLGSPDTAEDIARVRAVHDAVPGAALILDPNGAWDADTAVGVITELAGCHVVAVEQPVPAGQLDALEAVATAVSVPVIADEDAASVEDLVSLPAAVAGINIKLAECGGLHAAATMIGWARHAGVDVMLGCQASTSLGIAPAAHLSGAARWVDLDGHLLIADDPWRGLAGADGVLRRPAGAGVGVRRCGAA